VSVHHPWVAMVGTLGWEGALGAGTLVARAAGAPASRRLEQAGTAMDLALGRRVTRYGACYQQYVLSWLRFMESKGLATPGESVPELDEVFIDVGLVPRAPYQVGTGVLADAPAEAAARQSIWDFLDRPQPAVLAVIGAPGSGKTTLLRHVARRVAGPSRGHRRTLPILLELRSHSGQISESAATLPQLLRGALPDLKVTEPSGWWEAQLRRGACVVLLDGLDEVADDQDRQAISAWVEAQIAAYPGNDFVITSRPHGYRTAVIGPALVLQARPFTTDQAKQFLSGWYRAAERRATGATGSDVELRADPQSRDLIERLAAAPALYDLMVNPLLLTMIANVHRYRAALPGSRAELYREMCQVMLYRRAEAKRLVAAVPGPAKERLLRQLAYTMMCEQVPELSRDRVLAELRPGLRRVSGAPKAQDFLDDVGNNGLLIEREKDQYAFAHLTFQEYLAAAHIQDKGLVRVLLQAVDQPWWRETILLYTADADADPIVQACVDAGTIATLSLAYDCAENAYLAPELRESLELTLDAAFAPAANPERRRLVAGVLAARHLSHLIPTPTGTLICLRPVPADLYRIFLHETLLPSPDGHCPTGPRQSAPATGIWAADALVFLVWINTLVPSESLSEYRLPTVEELDYLAATARTSAPANAWATAENRTSPPRLWTAPGALPSPHLLTGAQLLEAVTADAADTPVLFQMTLLTAHVNAKLIRHALTRNRPFGGDRTFDRALDRALAPALTRNLKLARTIALALNLDLNLALDLDLDQALNFASDLALDLSLGLNHALTLALDLNRALARALDLARDRTFDRALGLDQALDLARDRAFNRALASDLALDPDRPLHPDRALDLDLSLDRDRDRDQDRDRDKDRDRDLVESWGRYLADFSGDSFASALALVEQEAPDAPECFDRFARALLNHAGITATSTLHPLPDSLAGMAQQACTTVIQSPHSNSWDRAAAQRLAENATAAFERRDPLAPGTVSAIRLTALALAHSAGETGDQQLADDFRMIAAGVTLPQHRASRPAELESLVLART
jgi:NACHT domain